ncbi:uncharacterized protein N7511_009395 [Penicillium nucicola]|uniref:uncharacterized protein n=1 Tax=Penicillium nucicola TaxID=1850975 RepID=UPI002544DE9D|nr:uncharacterized protein N7511_009395 [Penicillium nucicola]KAJ5747699.1 hypothetical protein N7511_009395 [Penicillium nucicola]
MSKCLKRSKQHGETTPFLASESGIASYGSQSTSNQSNNGESDEHSNDDSNDEDDSTDSKPRQRRKSEHWMSNLREFKIILPHLDPNALVDMLLSPTLILSTCLVAHKVT